MKLYLHRGPGHYVGSIVVVCADTKEQAESLIRKTLDEHGLSTERLNVEEVECTSGTVIHADSGDY